MDKQISYSHKDKFLSKLKVHTRVRKTVAIIFVFGTITGLVHIIHALTLDRIIEYREETFYSARLPEHLDGYRIAFVVDVHAMPHDELEEVVRQINSRDVDLLLLGGDFSLRDGHYRRSMEILSRTETTDGIFGVEGNHDNYVRLFAAKEAYGIVPLSNSGLHIQDRFFLAGLEDLWNRRPCIATATYRADTDDFVLLLTHNPDVSMQQDTSNVDLILAGHTHGGQITLFGQWALYFTFRSSITNYGQRFASGWSTSRHGTPVYVSRGTTVQYYSIPRIFARPQVIILTLRSEHNEV